MNWLEYLAKNKDIGTEVRVYTLETPSGFHRYEPISPDIRIYRLGKPDGKRGFSRYGVYLRFYSSVIRKLSAWKANTVMYYETLSAFPAYFYKKFIHQKSRLFIHYHEYISRDEYRSGMLLNRWGHFLERKIYCRASWVSHTNADRMRLFKADNEEIPIPNTHILPNYPPGYWTSHTIKKLNSPVVKFVYIGALSLDTMYTKEFAEWIRKQNGSASWDIYSGNITADAKAYLQAFAGPDIRLHKGVNYFSLPQVLKAYDIGVILYKGHIPNYVYNAPNKLFEYGACGLDVWFPDKMSTSLAYVTTDNYPRVVALDFEKLDDVRLSELTDHSGLAYQSGNYFCEPEFDYLWKQCISG
jgi:hypothetical protein